MNSDTEDYNEEVSSVDVKLKMIISMNNELLKTIQYLEKLNAQLCNMVSNIINVNFVINLKINEIQKTLAYD